MRREANAHQAKRFGLINVVLHWTLTIAVVAVCVKIGPHANLFPLDLVFRLCKDAIKWMTRQSPRATELCGRAYGLFKFYI
jgi:hypothetical protein